MDLEKRESKVFDEIPVDFINKALYACDTGNLEYLKYLVTVKNLNFNKKFTDIWALDGYDEAMGSVKKEMIELKSQFDIGLINFQDYLILSSRLQRKRKTLTKEYTGTCPYGSLLDAMIRYAIEARQFEIVEYLLKQDAEYSRCFQTFYTSIEYGLSEIIDFLLESKLELHRYSRGYVGDRVRILALCNIKKYKKERKRLKKEMKS